MIGDDETGRINLRTKVLWIVASFPENPESARDLYLWHSIEALSALNVDVYVLLTTAWRPWTKSFVNVHFPVSIKNCRYFSLPRHYGRYFSNLNYTMRVSLAIRQLVKKYQINIIHAHGEICGLAAVAFAKKWPTPVVLTLHGIDTCKRLQKKSIKKQFSVMLNQVNKIIFVGESLQKYFQSLLNHNDHCCVVYNGVQFPVIPTNAFASHDINIVRLISVSNLHEGKGIDFTLQALAALHARGVKNWMYTIVGSGDQRKYLEKIAEKFNIQDKVHFTGICSHAEVYAHLRQSHVFCLPSYREAFGIAYLEAMAHGLLTIAVRDQGPQAFIEHGKTGFLVPARDRSNKKHAFIEKYVLSNFSWEKHAERLKKVYAETIAEN